MDQDLLFHLRYFSSTEVPIDSKVIYIALLRLVSAATVVAEVIQSKLGH